MIYNILTKQLDIIFIIDTTVIAALRVLGLITSLLFTKDLI